MKKLYYSIGEVSKLLNIEQHILRYWEKEFTIIKPKKNRAGNRAYSSEDIELLKLIKNLLEEKELSIKQANELLSIYKSKNEIIKNFDNIVKGYQPPEKKQNKKSEQPKTTEHSTISPEVTQKIKSLIDEIIEIIDN